MVSAGLPNRALAAAIVVLIINAKLRRLGKKLIVAPQEQTGTGLEPQIQPDRAPMSVLAGNVVAPDHVDIGLVVQREA